MFSPPCGVSSVLRFKKLDEFPVLITCRHPTGVPGLPPAEAARVRRWLSLCHRCCVHARFIFDNGGNFIIEGPPQRNAATGPFAACCGRNADGSLKFPEHYTIFQTPSFLDLAAHCKLEYMHLHSCFFTDRDNEVSEGAQKLYTFAHTPALVPAFQSISAASCCHHAKHNTSLVGPGQSARSERYPGEIYGILARGLMRPDEPAWVQPETCAIEDEVTKLPTGLRADQRKAAAGVTATRAQGAGAKASVTSKLVHDRFVHAPAARLRGLVDVCDDIPFAWRELLNVSSDVCPECLRGKTHKQGSSAHVPVCTEPGQIVSFDLWKYHIASVCGGYIYFFGAVDNYTSFGFLVALKYKSEAPRALGEVLR